MPDVLASHQGPIGVVGLWHLGCVTAASLAQAGYDVVGVDPDDALVDALADGRPPVSEPGLDALLASEQGHLRFSSDARALAGLHRAWVTFDTPVDDDDSADVEWVLARARELLAPLADGALVIVSSQLPVGSVARLEACCAEDRGTGDLRFACLPENLRLGDALASFRAQDRVVAGVRNERDRLEVAELLEPFEVHVEWMKVESAEMTKHALNGFLATSVAFINEVSSVCEAVGADAAEVSRGLKSERRIGPRSYLAPGDAFAGGTLARDIGFLRDLASRHSLPDEVFAGVARGNAAHRGWAQRKLGELLGRDGGSALAGRTVAVWGLTYKPGTDTLRRSGAVELCRWLAGARSERAGARSGRLRAALGPRFARRARTHAAGGRAGCGRARGVHRMAAVPRGGAAAAAGRDGESAGDRRGGLARCDGRGRARLPLRARGELRAAGGESSATERKVEVAP